MSALYSFSPAPVSINSPMSTVVEPFSKSDNCRTPGCAVTLALDDNESTKLFVCKHTLVKESDYFEKMFYGDGNFTEKVDIEGVTKSELVAFLSWVTAQTPVRPLPSDASSLCALITLADRFACPTLEKQLADHLGKESMFQSMFDCSPDTKLKLLEAADKHRGENGCILEASIRLCANLDIDQLSTLTGKIAFSSLAAAYAVVGRAMTERFQKFTSAMLPHTCTTAGFSFASDATPSTLTPPARLAYVVPATAFHYSPLRSQVKFKKICGTCDESEEITGCDQIAFGKVKQIKIEKELFFG